MNIEVIDGELVLSSQGLDEWVELGKLHDNLKGNNSVELGIAQRCLTIKGNQDDDLKSDLEREVEDLSSKIDDIRDIIQ